MTLHPCICFCQIDTVIDTHRFIRILHNHSIDTQILFIKNFHKICQVIFLLCVIIGDFLQTFKQCLVIETENSGVDFFYLQLFFTAILCFNNLFHFSLCIADNASIALPVRQHACQYGTGSIAVAFKCFLNRFLLNAGAITVNNDGISIQTFQSTRLHDGVSSS